MSPTSTFADLIAVAKADHALPDARRRHVVCDLGVFVREGGRRPAAVPATVAGARELIRAMRQRPLGVKRKRWANIRASVNFALARYCGVPEQHWEAGRELQGGWRELRGRITDLGTRIQLSRLFRYCTLHHIAPDQVTDATFPEFRVWLERWTSVIDPAGRFRRTCLAWNKAADTIEGWPQIRVAIESRSKAYTMPEAFPDSFQAEMVAWRAALAGDDIFADRGPVRPLRPRTIKHLLGTVCRFASGMVLQGVPTAEIRTMADLFTPPERFRLGLRFQLARHDGKPSPGTTAMADTMLAVARNWVQIDPVQYRLLQRDAKRVECRQNGLTPTNLQRLAQFDDPTNILALLDLPDRLLELARRRPRNDRDAALLAQMAVAILILLFAPMRLQNLAGCHLDRHIFRAGSGRRQPVRFMFEGEEVKNHRPANYPIPEVLARVLDLYLDRYRPLLLGSCDGGWLFPGRFEGPKAKEALARQITRTVRQHTGLVVHCHFFRHLAALLSDLADPGNIDQIRRLLLHRSNNMTSKFYSGFATDRAARRYHEQVLGRMVKGRKGPRP